MGHAIGAAQAIGADLKDERSWGSMRFFLGNQSERVELDSSEPGSGWTDPAWKPTHWALATVLTYDSENWTAIPRDERADAVVKIEAVSIAVEPVVNPEACSLIEVIDVTERFLPLLPRAFEMLPTG